MSRLIHLRRLTSRYGGLILILFHGIGIFLLGGSFREDFVFLTPYNLLLMLVVYLLASQPPKHIALYFAPIFLGYIIEVLGTHTGWPFGIYTYGTALGPSLFQTPILIGVLWWILIRSCYDVSGRWTSNRWIRAFLTGLAMVTLDFLIEPVAIELGFWQWHADKIPLENYVAWFILATIFSRLTAAGNARNKLSSWVIITLTLFFATLNIVFWK